MSKPDIGCLLLRLTYNFDVDTCHLYLPDGACVDMQKAIHFVQSKFPDTVRLFSYSGSKVDTVYTKEDGVWYANETQVS